MRAIAQARDAGICRRVAALLLDLAIALAVLAFAALVLHRSGVVGALAGDSRGATAAWPAFAAPLALCGMLALATVLSWRHLGGTPGTLLLGMTVRRTRDGAPPSYLRAAARGLVAVGLLGIGVLWSFNGRPALHDRLTGTRLVLEDDALCTLGDFGVRDA